MSRREDRPKREDRPPTEQPTGSPSPGEPVFLVVGKLRRPHGVRGEMVMDVITDFPERLQPGVVLYTGTDFTQRKIRSVRAKGKEILIAFEGIDSPEEAGELRNELIHVQAEDRPPLEEGEYYHHQLIGMRVVDEEGRNLGILSQILSTEANDVYIVTPPDGPELLLPATEEVILDVNLEAGEIQVHILPGLLGE